MRSKKGLHTQSRKISFKKAGQSTRAGSSRTWMKDGSQRAEINLNPEGFYEVSVQYGLSTEIGRGYGFKTKDVEKALIEDNLQCRLIVDTTPNGPSEMEED